MSEDSIIEELGLEKAMRQAMSGRIDEFQRIVDEDTVYCEPCEMELDWTPSVLQVHNSRRHQEASN